MNASRLSRLQYQAVKPMAGARSIRIARAATASLCGQNEELGSRDLGEAPLSATVLAFAPESLGANLQPTSLIDDNAFARRLHRDIAPKRRPAGHLLREGDASMGRTRGGQGGPLNRALCIGERRQYVSLVELCRGGAIEANEADVRMGVKVRAKIVRDGIRADSGIETSGAGGGRQDIPERDVLLGQYPNTV